MVVSVQHSRILSHQPLARPRRPQLPTEILSLIVAHLTRRDLLSSSKVCKAWRPSASHQLWKNIDRLPLNEEFLQLIPTHGHLIHRLDLIFHSKSKLKGVPGDLLAGVLQDTPRLHHLSIQLLEYDSDDIVPPVLKAIKDYVSGQLNSLELKGMSYHISNEEVEALLPSLTQLTRFEMDGLPNGNLVQMLHSLPLLTAIALRGDRNPTRRGRITGREGFQDSGLIAIGILLPLLKDLTVHFNRNILDVGLGQFSEFCPRLTRIDLRGCQGISSEGLASFLGAQPHLTHVSLADTLLQDSGLLVLAAPARAAQLQILNIRKCRLVQAHGVGQVVRACTNIRELNFSLCPAVWMEVFAGTWACLRLLRLNFGGIHRPVPAQNGSDTYFSRVVHEGELEQMYAQLRRLHFLEELTLLPLPFQLRLFELGRTSIESMTRLEHISLVGRASALEDRDIIWLATRLPSLRTLDLDECTARSTLLRDLGDINRSLKINLLYSRDLSGVRDPNLEDTEDSDSDSDSESDGDSNHYFGYGGGGNNEDDDSDDDNDDSYYSPGEEPYQPEYFDYYDSDHDYNSGNMYLSATPPSNSDDYETNSGDDSDDGGDGHSGDSLWAYRNPYYPGSDSDEPVPYYSDSQDVSEGDSKEDSSEGEDSSQLDDSDDSTDSGSADDDESGQSELSSDEESGAEDDDSDDEDGSEVETDVTSGAGSVGDFDDDDRSQAGGACSDESLSGEEDDDGSEDDSGVEDEDDEQEEEDEEEQYSDEEVEEDEEEGKYSDEQEVDEEDDYYDDYKDHTDDYDGYQDYDSDAGGYDTDDY